MKDIKANNVIFPIWFLLFFPPVIFITLIGNFIIDSLVILLCFYIHRILNRNFTLFSFYKKSIWKVWFFGFLADIIGASVLFVIGILDIGVPYNLASAINYDPFSEPLAVVIIVFAIFLSTTFIFLFNYAITFKQLIEEKTLRFKLALTIAILTMPWTFLLPTKWFY